MILLCGLFVMSLNELYAYGDPQRRGSVLTEKGYSGSVGCSLTYDEQLFVAGGISTTHGYGFGNGLWLGGGMEIFIDDELLPSIPIYARAKYSYHAGKVCPFVSCNLGFSIWHCGYVMGYISPSLGVDFSSWSFFVSYNDMEILKYGSIGFSWNF